MILDDLEEYEKAEDRLREAIEGFKIAFGEEHPHTLKNQYGRTPLSWAAGNGYDTVMAVDVFSILHHYSRTLWSSVLGSRLGYGRVVHQRSLPMNSHPLPSSSLESRPPPLSIECASLDAST